MDGARFDRWARLLGERLSRRRAGGLLLALGVMGAAPARQTAAKPKHKPRKKTCKHGTTKCGKHCINTQADALNCGGCNKPCGDTERCQGGACVATGCQGNEIDCGGGLCIDDAPNACCNQADCGPLNFNNDLVCNTTSHLCVCKVAGQGICRRFSDDSGSCDVCCGSGSGECPGDYVCRTDSQNPTCDCPSGYERCLYSEYGTCSSDQQTDPRHCGIDCIDCGASAPGTACCGGFCIKGCAPGHFGSGCYPDDPCGSSCAPCPDGKICCNTGPGTAPSCVLPAEGGFYCP